MMQLTVAISCNDCGEKLRLNGDCTSASEARLFAVSQGWKVVTVFRVHLEFCPDCQEAEVMAVGN